MIDIDEDLRKTEDLRKAMGEALENGDYATALELSQELDKKIAFIQKLKSITAFYIFQS